nr:Sugar phosphate exchanger 2, putative [Ipomoea batatas]GME02585.1 Sugar phosphate exchanger 2, putative [Ipomoea batatas]
MSGSTAKTPISHRSLDKFFRYSGEPKHETNLKFEFLDENLEFSETSFQDTDLKITKIVDEEDDDKENSGDTEENKAFWESKEELLQANICRTTVFESEIRKATKEAIKELNLTGATCTCRKMVADNICRCCMQKEISHRLQSSGYNCTICKSKWKSSPELPSGEHTYMEVVQKSSSKKGAMKVIIELNFRGEFEMGRASEEYNRLVKKLPEVYVGKLERLQSLIKILCAASKKCMEKKKRHLAPWRKHKYMQSKWLGSPELKPEENFPVKHSERPPQRPTASMLTFDLLDSLPAMHFTPAIRVV